MKPGVLTRFFRLNTKFGTDQKSEGSGNISFVPCQEIVLLDQHEAQQGVCPCVMMTMVPISMPLAGIAAG